MEQPPVCCPFDDQYQCKSELTLREIRALLNEKSSDEYEQYLKKSIKLASFRSSIDKIFLCKTPDCDGFCYYEESTKWFLCPLCQTMFCLQCKELHNEQQQCRLDSTVTELEQQPIKELTEEEKKSERFIQVIFTF